MGVVTDIVITSRNRLDCLARTLDSIYSRTTSPYAIHVVDDASNPEVVDYLLNEWRAHRIESLALRGKRVGHMSNENLAPWLAFSDPFVLTMDDVLCPLVEPDWLTRGRTAILDRPQLAELDLNHPGAPHGPAFGQDDLVTYCEAVGGTLAFIRRAFVERFHFAHHRDNFGWADDLERCAAARRLGYQVGFLTDTFCYHIGTWSELCNCVSTFPVVPVLNWDTLEPPSEFVWRKPAGWTPPTS